MLHILSACLCVSLIFNYISDKGLLFFDQWIIFSTLSNLLWTLRQWKNLISFLRINFLFLIFACLLASSFSSWIQILHTGISKSAPSGLRERETREISSPKSALDGLDYIWLIQYYNLVDTYLHGNKHNLPHCRLYKLTSRISESAVSSSSKLITIYTLQLTALLARTICHC